jgi:hypothetical protein
MQIGHGFSPPLDSFVMLPNSFIDCQNETLPNADRLTIVPVIDIALLKSGLVVELADCPSNGHCAHRYHEQASAQAVMSRGDAYSANSINRGPIARTRFAGHAFRR